MNEAEARQRHPAGKKFVPKVKILERLAMSIDQCYWLYGEASCCHPNPMERWDVRSLIDYAVLTTTDAQTGFMDYGTFYLRRNTICQLLMEMKEFTNWGEWRMWETEAGRTQMQILSVVQKVLDAERSSEHQH